MWIGSNIAAPIARSIPGPNARERMSPSTVVLLLGNSKKPVSSRRIVAATRNDTIEEFIQIQACHQQTNTGSTSMKKGDIDIDMIGGVTCFEVEC